MRAIYLSDWKIALSAAFLQCLQQWALLDPAGSQAAGTLCEPALDALLKGLALHLAVDIIISIVPLDCRRGASKRLGTAGDHAAAAPGAPACGGHPGGEHRGAAARIRGAWRVVIPAL